MGKQTKRYDLAIDGFFLAIGHKPNSEVFKLYLDTDEVGVYPHGTRNSPPRFPACLPLAM